MATLSSAFAELVECPSRPIMITSNRIAAYEGSEIFDFGHDLDGNAINPLPDGGQLQLDSLALSCDPSGKRIYTLGFSFPHPVEGTTVLQYSACGTSCSGRGFGLGFIGRGLFGGSSNAPSLG